MPRHASSSDAIARFTDRAAALRRAGLPIGDGTAGQFDALLAAVRLGADPETILEAAVESGQDLAAHTRGRWRHWFYPLLVCAGAALGTAFVSLWLTPFLEAVHAEFRVPQSPGLWGLEWLRALAPLLFVAMLAALTLALFAATVHRSRETPADPLRAALGCETLAALAEAGVPTEQCGEVAAGFGLGSGAATGAFSAWAIGEDTGAIPRIDALRLASKTAKAAAARRDGEGRQAWASVASLLVAGVATLAYALVLFVPVVEFFMSIASASASR